MLVVGVVGIIIGTTIYYSLNYLIVRYLNEKKAQPQKLFKKCPYCKTLIEGELWFNCKKCKVHFTLPIEELKKVIDEKTGK